MLTQNMGEITVSGLRDREVEQIEREAEEIGTSRAEYMRHRFRAGQKLWDAQGNFNKIALNDLFNQDDSYKKSSTGQQTTTDTSSETGTLSKIIKQNLKTDEPTPVHSDRQDDLVDIVINELVYEALEELQEAGEVQYKPGKGYIKK